MGLLVRAGRLAGRAEPVDLQVGDDGTIASIRPASPEPPAGSADADVLDAAGRLLTPPYVEPHVHLDASLTAGQPRWNTSGTLWEGIACWAERKPMLTREDVIDRGEVVVDLPRRTVDVRGTPVSLTFVEFELLALLASEPGVVFSRRQLLERIRGSADYREPRTIDVHVRHLREKIERDSREPELILTVRGAGYRFRDGA